MITSTQITNTKIFVFVTFLVFKLLNRKVLFINKKDKETVKNRLFFKKIVNFTDKLERNYR